MNALLEKLKGAKARVDASSSQILQPGDYGFLIREASMKHDDKRQYDYLYIRLDCDGRQTSDRFPITDNMLWKFVDLLAAVGIEIDNWVGPADLVGRKGELTATKDGSATYYRYLAEWRKVSEIKEAA
jgi:hypothetical protein